MEIVIDAQIIKGYFQESVLGIVSTETELTYSTLPLIERLGLQDKAYVDEGKQIETEWNNVTKNPEWFRAWYINMLEKTGVVAIKIQTCNTLRKKLEQNCGFPRGNKDFWYIRVAVAVSEMYDHSTIVSEDLDFYEPSEKKATSARRLKILHSADGTVNRLLRGEKVDVKCVAAYISHVQQDGATEGAEAIALVGLVEGQANPKNVDPEFENEVRL